MRDYAAVRALSERLCEPLVPEEYVIQPQIKANGPAKGNPLPDWPADVKAKQQAYDAKAAK